MYLFGTKRALMKVLEAAKPTEPGKPPGPVQEQSYILSEGERQGEVEVLAIDDKAGRVKVDNYGTTMLLPLTTNMPPATAPGPGAMPVPGAAAAAAFPGGMVNPAAPGSPFTTFGGAGAPANPALTTIPQRTLRLPVPAAPPAPVAPQTPQSQTPGLSPDEQMILMHAIHESDPSGPPPPPLPQ
jgi:hypothetical protein